MDNPRAEKVAVVDEVRQKFDDADAVLLTEYRGLDVASISALRRSLRQAGGDGADILPLKSKLAAGFLMVMRGAAENDGYTATRHQREVGAGYFDDVATVISGGTASTLALVGSTESEQF